jgi:hypothetical protein
MAIRENLIQARSLYVGVSPNVGPAASNLIVDGSIGIGTPTPISPLSIYRGAGSNAYIEVSGGGSTLGVSSTLFGQGEDLWGYVWNRANQPIIFGTNNSSKMILTAAGELAVGTTTPLLSNSPSRGNITLNGLYQSILTLGVGGVWKAYLYTDGNTTDLSSANYLVFGTNGGFERMRITAGGNVGIGTTTPDFNLTINGITGIQSSGTTKYHFAYYNGGLNFAETGIADYRLFIKDGGNVGIGISNPQARLEVADDVYINGGNGQGLRMNGGMSIFRQNAADLAFNTNNSESMRITAGGYVGIGNSSPNRKLTVTGEISSLYGSNQGSLWLGDVVNFAAAFTSYGVLDFTLHNGGGFSDIMRVQGNGRVGIGTTTPIASLDNQGGLGTYRQRGVTTMTTDILYSDGPNAARYEIARATIDYNDWNETGTIEIELYEKYYSDGLKKRYVVSYGWASGYSKYLVEMSGTGSNNMQVSIGTPVVISGDIRYLPIYVDLRFYGRCNAIVKTNRNLTTNNPPAMGEIWFNNAPSITYISDFSADSTVYAGNVIGGNTIFPSGNVGIGTTSPGYKLDVAGTFGTSGDATFNGTYTNINSSYITIGNDATDVVGVAGSTMYFPGNGNVGIGTTNPSEKLDVNGTGKFGAHALIGTNINAGYYQDNTNGAYRSVAGAGNKGYYFQNYGGSNTYMYVGLDGAYAGKVGIGTSVPDNRLTVNGGISGTPSWNNATLEVRSDSGLTAAIAFHRAGYTVSTIYSDDGSLVFGESGGERMRISGGNVGIGTTNPVSKLTVKSPGEVGSYGDGFVLQRNANTAKIIRMYESSADGFIEVRTGADDIVSKISGYNGTPTFFLSNVGIGTTNPGYKLDVNGAGRFIFRNNSNEITDLLLSTEPDNSKSKLSFLWYGNETAAVKFLRGGNSTGSSMEFWTQPEFGSTIQRMTITSGGYVGISNTSPTSILHITDYKPILRMDSLKAIEATYDGEPLVSLDFYKHYGLGQGASIRMLQDGGTTSYVQAALAFYTNDVSIDWATPIERMRIKANGDVGIGTTNPTAKLQVEGSGIVINTENSNQSKFLYFRYSNGGDLRSDSYLTFSTSGSPTERMRITDTGNVGIGTTNPAAKLEVYGTGFTSGSVNFLARNGVGTKIIESFDDGFIRLNNTLNINQAIYINIGNSNVHYAQDAHIFSVVNDSYQRTDFVTIKGNLGKPAMGVGTMSPDNSAILDLTSRSKGFLPPRMTYSDMMAIASPAAGLVVYDVTNNKLTVYAGSGWVPLH